MPELTAVILAAGKGTRMKSDRAKVLHELLGKPMIHYVVKTVLELGVKEPIVVIGHQAEQVKQALVGFPCRFVCQKEQKGTGHAVMQARKTLNGHTGHTLIICGDTPLLTRKTLKKLVAEDNSLLVAELDHPYGYGRIIRSGNGYVERIVEEKDANPETRRIKEVNAGTYTFNTQALFEALKEVGSNNAQKEFYLTDVIEIFNREGVKITGVSIPDSQEISGINDLKQLAAAEKILQSRKLM